MLLCSILVISFAIFVFEDTSNHDNSITTGTISFSYNEDSNGIEITNAIPIDDSVGKKITNDTKSQGVHQGYFDFSVSGNTSGSNINYQVYATLEDGSNMDTNYIKVYLTDDNNIAYSDYANKVPVFNNLKSYSEVKNSKLLYTGTIKKNSNKSQKFRLRLWVDKNYTDGSTSKTFKIKINVKATA